MAAPTAGLHFDQGVINRLAGKGVDVVSVVLHVGPGTFSPLDVGDVESNRLQRETFEIEHDALCALIDARAQGKRIVAVGTTTTRVLETIHRRGWLDAEVAAGLPPETLSGETDLFIYPGYHFKSVDRLITNFHLPESSLLLLVSAFLGREQTMNCYRQAVAESYRFYSYGDAMLIL